MCISLLSDRVVTIHLLGEYIYLRLDGQTVRAKEVYDFFFSVSSDWDKPRLVLVSPHVLIDEENRLHVKPSTTPGSNQDEEDFYSHPIGFGCKFDPTQRIFSAKICNTKKTATPQTLTLAGEVIVPTVSVNATIENDLSALEVMSSCGTTFELSLPSLQANKVYAMRLTVKPVELLGLNEARNLEQFGLDPVRPNWIQDAVVTCPKNCWFDYKQLLQRTKEDLPDLKPAADAIAAIVTDTRLTIARIERARIVLAAPMSWRLVRGQSMGCITPGGIPVTKSPNVYTEYYGGIETYWTDDVIKVGQAIYTYLSRWAAGDPKTKEYITTALGIQHENCSLLVDKMAERQIIEIVDAVRGLCRVRKTEERLLYDVLEDIAKDPDVNAKFDWSGYRIPFTVQYAYLNVSDQRRLDWARKLPKVALWLALIGIVVAVVGLLLTLGQLLVYLF
jgi:hypothetical protein